MKKIDWYIFKRLIGTFFFAILIFAVISVVIDITEKVDYFLEYHLSPLYIFTHYYLGFIPHILALLFPLFIFIAVIYFTSKLAYKSEIIAILSTGVSYHRLLRPYWVGRILLALLLGISNRTIIPHANVIKVTFENNYVDKKKEMDQQFNLHLRINNNQYMTMSTYYPEDQYASGFELETIKGQKLISRLEARNIRWNKQEKGWKAGMAILREIDKKHVTVTEVRDTVLYLNIDPQDLIKRTNIIEGMTTRELNQYIDRQKLRSAQALNYLYIEKYRRTSSAFSIIILTLIGAVIATKKTRGGSGLHLALGIVLSALYVLFMQFSTTFSIKGSLNPLIAVWITNIVFGLLAIYLYRKAPK